MFDFRIFRIRGIIASARTAIVMMKIRLMPNTPCFGSFTKEKGHNTDNIMSANNAPLASHSRLSSRIIRSQHSLLWLLHFVKTSHCDVFTRSPTPSAEVVASNPHLLITDKTKSTPSGVLLFYGCGGGIFHCTVENIVVSVIS